MGLKDLALKAAKALATCGSAAGSSFPLGTKIATGATDGERCLYLTYPDKTEEIVYHHMIKCATVLAMGVIEIEKNSKGTTLLHGVKYLVVFNDGRQGVFTVGLGSSMEHLETVLF